MAKCGVCGEETIPYKCSHCGGCFCVKHRLPENHDCVTIKTLTVKHIPVSDTETREYKHKKFVFSQKLWFPIIHEALNGIFALMIGIHLITNHEYYWLLFLNFAPELAKQWADKMLPTAAIMMPFLGFIVAAILNFTSIYGLIYGKSLVIRYTEIIVTIRIIISAVFTVLISIIYFVASGALESIPPILSLGGFILPQVITTTAIPWINWLTIILGVILIIAFIYTIKEGFKITLSDIFFLLLLILLVLIFGAGILAFILLLYFAFFITSLIGALATIAFPIAFFLSFLTASVPMMYSTELITFGIVPYPLFIAASLFTLVGNIAESKKMKKV